MDEIQSLKIILDRIDSEIQYLDNLLSQFNCVICMDYLKDPLTLNCGHTFCKQCLIQYDNYFCSICRKEIEFESICNNVIITNLFEDIRKKKHELIMNYNHHKNLIEININNNDKAYIKINDEPCITSTMNVENENYFSCEISNSNNRNLNINLNRPTLSNDFKSYLNEIYFFLNSKRLNRRYRPNDDIIN